MVMTANTGDEGKEGLLSNLRCDRLNDEGLTLLRSFLC